MPLDSRFFPRNSAAAVALELCLQRTIRQLRSAAAAADEMSQLSLMDDLILVRSHVQQMLEEVQAAKHHRPLRGQLSMFPAPPAKSK